MVAHKRLPDTAQAVMHGTYMRHVSQADSAAPPAESMVHVQESNLSISLAMHITLL